MSQQKWQQQQQRQQQQRRRRQMMYEWARQQENKRRPPSRMFSCSVCGKGPVQFCPYCRKLFCRSHLPRLTQDSQLRFVGHYCRPRKSMGRASPSSPSSKIQSGVERRLINPVAIGAGFLNYCIKLGWLIQEGKGRNARFYLTKEGEETIRKRFGIKV